MKTETKDVPIFEPPAKTAEYALATGPAAVRRLHLLHKVCSPAGAQILLRAGLQERMQVADFGCGVGATTRMLAGIAGDAGSVTGIDLNRTQLEQAAAWCSAGGMTNTRFVCASADRTGLPRESFDFVYCRFLLLHVPDPASCLREMRDVLKPGGILFVEDGDLASAGSKPRSAFDSFADLFSRLGPVRGVDYSFSTGLYHAMRGAGFGDVWMEIHQPVLRGADRQLVMWSVEEAGPAFVDAGLITENELKRCISEMHARIDDPELLVLGPVMSLAWARKLE